MFYRGLGGRTNDMDLSRGCMDIWHCHSSVKHRSFHEILLQRNGLYVDALIWGHK